jgi:hypothetical protein
VADGPGDAIATVPYLGDAVFGVWGVGEQRGEPAALWVHIHEDREFGESTRAGRPNRWVSRRNGWTVSDKTTAMKSGPRMPENA